MRQQLPDVPLFFGLSAEALEQVAALSSAIEVEAGQDVLEVVPYHFCILTHGSASVVLKDSGLNIIAATSLAEAAQAAVKAAGGAK